jgi:hypothetical protein
MMDFFTPAVTGRTAVGVAIANMRRPDVRLSSKTPIFRRFNQRDADGLSKVSRGTQVAGF